MLSKRLLPVLVGMLFFSTGGVSYASWDLDVSTTLVERYTDNLYLSPRGRESEEWVTQFSPMFIAQRQGAGAEFSFQYQLDNYYYEHLPGADSSFHQGRLDFMTTGRQQFLSLRAMAVYEQTLLDPATSLSGGEGNVSSNQEDLLQGMLSPSFRWHAGDEVDFLLSTSFLVSDYQKSKAYDSGTSQYALSLGNEQRADLFLWGVEYQVTSVDNKIADDVQVDHAALNLSHQLSSNVGLVASFGIDEYRVESQTAQLSEFWNAGLSIRVSNRGRVEFRKGERQSSQFTTANITYRSGKMDVGLQVNEEVVFLALEQLRGMTGASGSSGVNQAVGITGEVYLLRNKQLSIGYQGIRNNLTLELLANHRQLQSGLNLESTEGGRFEWRRSLSTLSSLNLSYEQQARRTPLESEGNLQQRSNLSWHKSLGRSIAIEASYSYLENNFNASELSYRNNIVAVTLEAEF